MSNVPYTYLVGWSIHNLYYYGVRYARGCHPDDLWKTYFTSSEKVKNIRKALGDPDIIKIRKIFKSKINALIWESKVLRRLKIKNNPIWLNQAFITEKSCVYFANQIAWNKGNPMAEEAKQHLSDLNKGKTPGNKGTVVYNDGIRHYYLQPQDPRIIELNLQKGGLPKSEEHRRKIGDAQKGKIVSEEQKERQRQFRHSDETKQIISEKRKLHSGPNKGKSPSLETRLKISQSLKNKKITDLESSWSIH